ncbi:hypothetical protein M378DRAFT_162109 [Amanita muscaria Koide BX008]|uniref:Uncharacterized protein n=1 Tax=Amanita muscaria (strain Koide BX008) TaxID=946122 RepID=A0A0C2TF56_AMAMK|nr:hypothetical protein M378DRAFT_162109 [Amanita muscaria Koide BX008]
MACFLINRPLLDVYTQLGGTSACPRADGCDIHSCTPTRNEPCFRTCDSYGYERVERRRGSGHE